MVIINNVDYNTLKDKIDFIKKYKFFIKKNCCNKHPFIVLRKYPEKKMEED